MTAADTITVLASPLDNVPMRGYRKAYANAKRVFESTAACGVFTETWSPLTRLGIRQAAKASGRHIRFHGRPGSVLLWWDTDKVVQDRDQQGKPLKGSFLLHGVVAGRFGLVSDPRPAPFMRLRVVGSSLDRFWLVGIHPSPSGSRKGVAAMKASQAAHDRALDRIGRWLEQHKGVPVVFAGDFNHEGQWVPAANAAPGSKNIVHVEIAHNGHDVGFRTGKRFALPYSDHAALPVTLRFTR